MCFVCNGDPVEKDPRLHHQRQWQTGMCTAACSHPCACLASFLIPCMSCYLRRKALNYDYDKYECCQGYLCACITKRCCCCTKCCPICWLTLETCICVPCAVSSTRMYIQDERQIANDPCDNRIIRCNNCLQCLACICNILACFCSELRELACIIDIIAKIVGCMVICCMEAQMCVELDRFPTVQSYGGGGGGGGVITGQPRRQ